MMNVKHKNKFIFILALRHLPDTQKCRKLSTQYVPTISNTSYIHYVDGSIVYSRSTTLKVHQDNSPPTHKSRANARKATNQPAATDK